MGILSTFAFKYVYWELYLKSNTMKNAFLIFIAALCVPLMAFPNPVDVNAASKIAQKFIESKTEEANARGIFRTNAVTDTELELVYKSPSVRQNSSEYYVFAPADSVGYVIVSGEDRVSPIVGYSLTDKFSSQQMPPALENLLSSYAQYVDAVRVGEVEPVQQTTEQVTPIFPFITTTWDQGFPYNYYSPTIDGQLTLTGCVATALAQIMNYYEWPKAGHGTCTATVNDGYDTPMTITLGEAYDWDNMIDDYYSGYTETEAQAVGLLMRDAGYACRLSYGLDATSGYATGALYALLRHFDYSPCAYTIDKGYYSSAAWREMIHGELSEGRPIWYRGDGSGGGHAFVCCGMDQDGGYYINWGWGGWADGYYYLGDFQNYNYYQQAIIGIKPVEGDESVGDYVPIPHIGQFEILEQNNSLLSPTVTCDLKVEDMSADTISGDVGYALFEDGRMISSQVHYLDSYYDLWPDYWYGWTQTLRLADVANLEPGIREIRFFWCPEGHTEWFEPFGDQCIYVETTSSGHFFFTEKEEDLNFAVAELADGYYYLRNEATGQFLTAANDWGTRASFGEHGLDVMISQLPNGKYTIDTSIFEISSKRFLGMADGALYMDVAETAWTIGVLENGNYVFTMDDGTTYMACGSGTVVSNLEVNPLSNSRVQWQLLTQEDMVARLREASCDNPQDATFFIKGAGFGRNDSRNRNWTEAPGVGGYFIDFCAEKWNSATFDVSQTLRGLPDGLYELRMRGFYREGGGGNNPLIAAANYSAGKSVRNAYLYANEESVPLVSIMSEALGNEPPNLEDFYVTSMGFVPQSIVGASAFFIDLPGAYQNSLQVEVADGTLHIGIKKDVVSTYDWTCFDNFELYYYGNGENTEVLSVPDGKSQPTIVYDLQGRCVDNPVKGIYIVNGRKVVIK